MDNRSPIQFSKWTPVTRDHHVGYSYLMANGRLIRPGSDRWMRAKAHIAAAAIASGADTFKVYGGTGSRRWQRIVTITQNEADEYFVAAISQPAGFMLKGRYRRVCTMRDRRLGL